MTKVRSIESIRAKRKRYRLKKKGKLKEKEQWEIRLEEDLCARWRKRRVNYEKEEKLNLEMKEQGVKEKLVVHNEVEGKYQEKEIMDCQADLYDKEASKTISATGALLLPTVHVPDQDHETSREIHAKLPISKLSGVD